MNRSQKLIHSRLVPDLHASQDHQHGWATFSLKYTAHLADGVALSIGPFPDGECDRLISHGYRLLAYRL